MVISCEAAPETARLRRGQALCSVLGEEGLDVC